METFFISPKKIKDKVLFETKKDQNISLLIDQYNLMESQILYFSVGESKVKSFLIHEEPTISL